MLRVRVVRVPTIPFGGTGLIDGTAIDEGDPTLWVWLDASVVSEDQAGELRRRFDGAFPVHEARTVARELCAAVS